MIELHHNMLFAKQICLHFIYSSTQKNQLLHENTTCTAIRLYNGKNGRQEMNLLNDAMAETSPFETSNCFDFSITQDESLLNDLTNFEE